jgi:hypothetical protein
MIDPIEALIAAMAQDADLSALVDGQIAERYKFGDGWNIPSMAIQVQLADGETDWHCRTQRPRVEVRCYGKTRPEAMQVYGAVVAFSRSKAHRKVVETSQGKALVYWFLMDSGPSLLIEEDTGIDFVLVYAKMAVAEQDV